MRPIYLILFAFVLCNPNKSYSQDYEVFIAESLNKQQGKITPFNSYLDYPKGPLRWYKRYIAPQLNTNCPYQPTCSSFSKQAFSTYSFPKALLLSIFRIQRCNGISPLEEREKSTDMQAVDLAEDYQ